MRISYRAGTIIIATVFVPLWLPFALRAIGFYVDTSGAHVGKFLAEKERLVTECNRILVMPWNVLSPGTEDQRRTCIHTFAGLTKDPSACELLMPSSYGLSCVGAAMNEYVRPCPLGGDRSVTWANGGKATLAECIQEYIHECCIVSQARFVVGFDTCEGIRNSEIKDQCFRELAFKNADPKFCENISTPIVQSACEVESSALQENAAICDGCVAPVNDLSELE